MARIGGSVGERKTGFSAGRKKCTFLRVFNNSPSRDRCWYFSCYPLSQTQKLENLGTISGILRFPRGGRFPGIWPNLAPRGGDFRPIFDQFPTDFRPRIWPISAYFVIFAENPNLTDFVTSPSAKLSNLPITQRHIRTGSLSDGGM